MLSLSVSMGPRRLRQEFEVVQGKIFEAKNSSPPRPHDEVFWKEKRLLILRSWPVGIRRAGLDSCRAPRNPSLPGISF